MSCDLREGYLGAHHPQTAHMILRLAENVSVSAA